RSLPTSPTHGALTNAFWPASNFARATLERKVTLTLLAGRFVPMFVRRQDKQKEPRSFSGPGSRVGFERHDLGPEWQRRPRLARVHAPFPRLPQVLRGEPRLLPASGPTRTRREIGRGGDHADLARAARHRLPGRPRTLDLHRLPVLPTQLLRRQGRRPG